MFNAAVHFYQERKARLPIMEITHAEYLIPDLAPKAILTNDNKFSE